jgi:shikimate kinase
MPGAGSDGASGGAAEAVPDLSGETMTGRSAAPAEASGGGPVCVLVGPPGAGKTTAGELVAAALGVAFRDTDADIVAVAGKPIPEIFFDDGEPQFRKLEAEAVATALESFGGVLALGAGAVLAAPTRARLAGHPVVYLEVGFADAIGRVGLGAGRPLLAMNPRATLRRLLDERRPLYEQVARHTVATDGLTPQEVAAAVVTLLRG